MEIKYIVLVFVLAFILLVLLGLAVVNYCGAELVEKFNKASGFPTNTTPVNFANYLNGTILNGNLKIKFNDNWFCDNYSSSGILTLCSKYANQNHIAGLAICAHELGHAILMQEQPNVMKKYAKRLSVCNLASRLIAPIFIAAILCVLFLKTYLAIVFAGVGLLFLVMAIFIKYSTLKMENDASSKALELLKQYADFTDQDIKIAKEFLNSAKQTYVADILKLMLKWTFLIKK